MVSSPGSHCRGQRGLASAWGGPGPRDPSLRDGGGGRVREADREKEEGGEPREEGGKTDPLQGERPEEDRRKRRRKGEVQTELPTGRALQLGQSGQWAEGTGWGKGATRAAVARCANGWRASSRGSRPRVMERAPRLQASRGHLTPGQVGTVLGPALPVASEAGCSSLGSL